MTLLLLAPMAPLGLLYVLLFAVAFVIVFGAVFWAVKRLAAAFQIGEPLTTVLIVALVLIAVFTLLYFLISNLTTWHP
jgi:hypothetical protein